jgi:seryl-tRNA synthetase
MSDFDIAPEPDEREKRQSQILEEIQACRLNSEQLSQELKTYQSESSEEKKTLVADLILELKALKGELTNLQTEYNQLKKSVESRLSTPPISKDQPEPEPNPSTSPEVIPIVVVTDPSAGGHADPITSPPLKPKKRYRI